MPHVGPVLEGHTFFCQHCGALYSVTRSKVARNESNTAKCVVCSKGHGQVGYNRRSDLQTHSST
jgi:predicted RNA-binding Zn-ribbon protein involved in translation (DUF1610 family)